MRPFERYAAGREAHELTTLVYRLSSKWPKDELFGITSQTRRAAVSICTNLSEGATRRGAREFRRFLDLARGSHGELQYLAHLAVELGYVRPADQAALIEKVGRTGGLLWTLYAGVARRAAAEEG